MVASTNERDMPRLIWSLRAERSCTRKPTCVHRQERYMEWHRSVTQYRSSGKNPRKTVGTRFMTPLGIFERMSEQEPYVIRSPLSMQEMPMVEARNTEWLPYCCMVLYGVQFIIPCAAQIHAGVGKPFIIPCAAQNHAGVGKPFIIPCAAQNHAG